MPLRYALRVALLFNGTVLDERMLASPSERRLTVGESRRADFVVPAPDVPGRAALFERAEFGYALNVLKGMSGAIIRRDRLDRIGASDGGARYVTPGDWGVLHLGPVDFFFQFVRPSARPRRLRWLPKLDGALVTALWFSLVVQALVIFVARLVG
jgi:hypothetical protein